MSINIKHLEQLILNLQTYFTDIHVPVYSLLEKDKKYKCREARQKCYPK